MKNFLSIVGGLFLILVLVVVGAFGYSAYIGPNLDASSKAYVEAKVVILLAGGDKRSQASDIKTALRLARNL